MYCYNSRINLMVTCWNRWIDMVVPQCWKILCYNQYTVQQCAGTAVKQGDQHGGTAVLMEEPREDTALASIYWYNSSINSMVTCWNRSTWWYRSAGGGAWRRYCAIVNILVQQEDQCAGTAMKQVDQLVGTAVLVEEPGEDIALQ